MKNGFGNLIGALIFVFLGLALTLPGVVSADRGMVVWPEAVDISEPAQNAIVGWNGSEEILILSADTQVNTKATVLRIIPFPSKPSIKEGDVDAFKKLTALVNAGIKADPDQLKNVPIGKSTSVEIVFQQVIGSHDLTTIKAEKLEDLVAWIRQFQIDKKLVEKPLTPEFQDGISRYLKKGINYFVFDVIDASTKETAKPLVYKFQTNYFYYPLLISGITDISDSDSKINLFFILNKYHSLINFDYKYFGIEDYSIFNITMLKSKLTDVSADILNLFSNNPDPEIRVISLSFSKKLKDLKKDLLLYPSDYWKKDLFLGNRGEDVKSMQRVLIGEYDLWNYSAGATGYFGSVTYNVLKKFQWRYIPDYLGKRSYLTGTGIFGPITRGYFKRISIFKYD